MASIYPRKINIAHLPTPIEKMERLTSYLGGPELLIKRDDQTGLAFGGNKCRKLEFLAADAVDRGNNHLVTTGAVQSNHCRQTAAVAARVGLGCSLVLRGERPDRFTGNLLIDRLLGAKLYWTQDRSVAEVFQEVIEDLQTDGNKPYSIPLGGSTAIGATGYVLAMEELSHQLTAQHPEIDAVILASSSGGTQAGMVLGAQLQGFKGRIIGISIDHAANELQMQISELASGTASYLGLELTITEDEVEICDDYLGDGYGIMSEAERQAIQLAAQMEGILLDPVYTGRAMAGLIDMIGKGAFTSKQRILFWHTGGTPALFAYDKELL